MTYEQIPPRVRAWKITGVGVIDPYNGVNLRLEDEREVTLDSGSLSRSAVNPNVGDYYVMTEQGGATVTSKAIFEKQWREVRNGESQ